MGAGSIHSNRDFYKGKKVFVTGHNGFGGVWLCAALKELGAQILGYSMPVSNCTFERIDGPGWMETVNGDILDYNALRKEMCRFQPEIVIHLAAMAIVKDCHNKARKAFEINIQGTVNLLEAVRECPSVKSVVVVTSDTAYKDKGVDSIYVETDELGGANPYACSKACDELLVECYRASFLQTADRMVGVVTARAANAIGGGDDHKDSRLVPQLIDGFSKGVPVQLRTPHQVKPWQDVLDVVNGYLTLGRYAYLQPTEYSGAWNVGPSLDGIQEVCWVTEKIQAYFEGASVKMGDRLAAKEPACIGISIQKMLENTDWQPERSVEETLFYTVDYFKRCLAGESEQNVLFGQIRQYFEVEGE